MGYVVSHCPSNYVISCHHVEAVAIGEWGKTRADDNFDVIAAQSKSLFNWVVMRYIAIFSLTSLFAILSMVAVFLIRKEIPLWELVFTYFSTAFCPTSFGVLIGLGFSREHIATEVRELEKRLGNVK